jgi:TraB/PrgY/gumN family
MDMKALILALGLIATATPTLAQTAKEAATVNEIVVVARRAEAPIWQVRKGDSTLILVGAVEGLPRDLEWRSEALVAAADRADRVLFPPARRASFADVGRLLWRIRTAAFLPDGKRTSDYLSPEMNARFLALEPDGGRTNLLMSANDLLERAGYVRRSRAAAEVVRASARQRQTPIEPIDVLHGSDAVEMLINTPPEVHRPCLEAAIAAAEAGPDSAAARADAWRRRRVQEVLNTPLEKAINLCWPWGAAGPEAEWRARWGQELDTALGQDGVTLAVAPLHLLAEPGGALDRLAAQGADISGPEWKGPPRTEAAP